MSTVYVCHCYVYHVGKPQVEVTETVEANDKKQAWWKAMRKHFGEGYEGETPLSWMHEGKEWFLRNDYTLETAVLEIAEDAYMRQLGAVPLPGIDRV